MMVLGGNNRAQVFFKQHGWTDGGKIESKYTSRAAELYRQILSKEVAKSLADDAILPSSPVAASQMPDAANGLPEIKLPEISKGSSVDKHDPPEVTRSPKAPIHSAVTAKKPIGVKKAGKSGGLGVRKLTTKPSESLYDQKPEEPAPIVAPLASSSTTQASTFPSRFEYIENLPSTETVYGGVQATGHVAPPKSSSFFADFGMDSGFQKKPTPSKVQVQESNEARQKFSNAKSISSAQFFGDQVKPGDREAQISLQKYSGSASISSADLFGNEMDDSHLDLTAGDLINRISFQASQDISSLKNMAGETGKKLTSIASSIMNDLQDRIL